jgi:hypothetical protein
MKKGILFMAAMIFLIAGILGTSTFADSDKAVTNLNVDRLKEMNITLNKPNEDSNIISSEIAIENAKKEFTELSAEAKSIDCEYQLITNPSFQMFSQKALDKNASLKKKTYADHLPVYIITFKGVQSKGIGHRPDGYDKKTFEDFNVVVDAFSG